VGAVGRFVQIRLFNLGGKETMDINIVTQNFVAIATQLGLKVLGAIALWIIGRWLIQFVVRVTQRALAKQNLDATVISYVGSTVAVLLKIMLVIAILGFFGVQTTTFAALLAAVGLAIGMAWSGLLANFAAGAFLVILHPFRLGDFISAGGVTGTVEEIGLFATTINTPDNVRTFVGNNKIFSDTIQNYAANPYRRVDLVAQLDHHVDSNAAIQLLKERVRKIPNVISKPGPDVEILQFSPMGPVLAVRPYCNNQHYWQVYFDTNKEIRDAFGEAGYPAPEQHICVRNSG
jgi:small conductance mechanosensitive channel